MPRTPWVQLNRLAMCACRHTAYHHTFDGCNRCDCEMWHREPNEDDQAREDEEQGPPGQWNAGRDE